MLKVYDSASKSRREFRPIDSNRVRIYSCGPTVYSCQHIGNLRAYIFSDLVKRVLLFLGYRPFHVMNITDVGHLTDDADGGDDKVEAAARAIGTDAWLLTEQYKHKFLEDCAAVNVIPPDVICRATDHIPEQIDLIRRIEARGHAYATDDGVYFDTASFSPVTDLSNMRLPASEEHSRVGTEGKRSSADFALWKFSSPAERRQMEWDSPWGKGFPGWHLECSAMSMKYLGDHFDLHTGGVDHIPVHHVNEIIQSESASGQRFVNYWMHGGWLRVGDSEKMSKSKGGTILLDDLIRRGYDPLVFRYLTLTAHYRSPLQFTWEALDAAKTAVERIRKEAVQPDGAPGEVSEPHILKFRDALSEDLNLPEALATLWSVVKDPQMNPGDRAATVSRMDCVLGLRLHTGPTQSQTEVPSEVLGLVLQRQSLKEQRLFKESDEVREQIRNMGFDLLDTPKGPALRSQTNP